MSLDILFKHFRVRHIETGKLDHSGQNPNINLPRSAIGINMGIVSK